MANGTISDENTTGDKVQANLNILIVEDEPFIAEQCRIFLKSKGHGVTTASDGQSGMYCYKRNFDDGNPFDLVITDYRMPKKDGAQVIKEILAINPAQMIILATAYGTEYAKVGFPTDKVPVLLKPFSFDDLTRLIEKQAVIISKVKGLGASPRGADYE